MDSEPLPADSHAGGPSRGRRAAAFIADADTKAAIGAALPEWEVDAHDGNIHTAIGALADGAAPKLILVDLDGVEYPSGSIHELAAVCEVGTVVVTVGSQDGGRYGRDILTTGVADYLIKPVTPTRLREVVVAAMASDRAPRWQGRSAGFAGTGGSGATTILAATAITAAARGRYVAVLDLNRAFSALPFLLDVEPAPGLDELLEAAAAGTLDPELLNAARVAHSDRISVFGYRWNPLLTPSPSFKSIRRLLAELCQRFHLVLVDPEPSGRVAVLQECDVRVLVGEPTRSGAMRLARAVVSLGAGASVLQVRNRTRPVRRADVRQALSAAGAAGQADVDIPFLAEMPELADWGQLFERFPRPLKKPVGRLIDLLAAAGADRPHPVTAAA